MDKEVIIKHLGYILLFNAVFLMISAGLSYFNQETSFIPLLYTAVVCVVLGSFPLIFSERTDNLNFGEGLAIVVFGWLLTCFAGMLPYVMWGGGFTLVDAWFESVSGYTTTGSTIINDIEALPQGLLLWRSFTHWIGGIGIILFVLLILPQSNKTRLVIYNAEISEISKLNFRLRARKIVQVLAMVYLLLTLAETAILTLLGMSLFDALNHAFATIATGGFSTKNASISAFNNIWIEITIIFFMLISGVHFGLVYGTVTGKEKNIFTSSLAKTFLLVIAIGVLITAIRLYFSGFYTNWWEALRVSAFQVVSLGTTTGFATEDTAAWPMVTRLILMYFTIQCAMVGSTSGGLKFDRVYMFFKSVGKQIKLLQHPQGVFVTRMENQTISEKMEQQTMVFIILYIFVFSFTTLILTFLNVDGETAFSASIATIGNVGPGFGNVSSLGNFAGIPWMGKLMLTINMLMGRLEIFNILALVAIKKWR